MSEANKQAESGSGSSHCSTAIDQSKVDANVMRSVRERLAASTFQRQRAVAMFPTTVASVAADLGRMLRLQEQGAESDELNVAIDHAENLIRTEYRRWFGCEIGQ